MGIYIEETILINIFTVNLEKIFSSWTCNIHIRLLYKKSKRNTHFYIDGTFIYSPGFQQLLVVLYYDDKKNKRYKGAFVLINNKTEVG